MPLRFTRRLWFRIPLYLLMAYALWCAVLYFYQDRLIFPRDLVRAGSAQPSLDNAVILQRPLSDGGTVTAWFFPAPGAQAAHPAPLAVYFHGNAEAIDTQEDIVALYHGYGYSVLLPEYRGYGRSAGKPSQQGIVSDVEWFLDQITARPEVDRRRVIYHGYSLGGGIAAALAAERPPAGLILQSTFRNVATLAHGYGAPGFLAKHPFRTDRVVARLDIPILILHGTEDTVIPVAHGRHLAALARRGTYLEFPCDHFDFPGLDHLQEYRDALERFLKETE